MLSTKSITFIDNLRLYLMTSGKNENEVNELTEELKNHLIESEKQGNSVDQITDGSPEEYMELLKVEMKTDYKGIIKKVPIFFLGIMAYYAMGPAIRGEFEINVIQVAGFPLIAAIGLLIYVVFLNKAGKKQYQTKRFFFFGMIASASATLLFIILLLGSNLLVAPFYQASPTINWMIVGSCTFIFIGGAVWSKTWFIIWIPALLFIPDFLFRFSNLNDTTILLITPACFVLMLVILIINLFLIEKKKGVKESAKS